MFELVFGNAAVQVLLLLLTAPLWWPVARTVWSELQRVGSEPRRASVVRRAGARAEGHDLGSARRTEVGLWSLEADRAWSKRRLLNPAWDRGRRQRPPGDPGERPSLTTRIVDAASAPRTGGHGRRPL